MSGEILLEYEIDETGHYFDERAGLYLPESMLRARVEEIHCRPEPAPRPLIGVDLFAGAGGFSLGMQQAGFDVVVAVEWWEAAAKTYAYNLGRLGGGFVFHEPSFERAFREECDKARRRRKKGTELTGPDPDDPTWFGWCRRDREDAAATGARAVILGDMTKITGADVLEAGGLAPGSVTIVFGGPPCQGISRAGRQDPHDPRNNLIMDFLRVACELGTMVFLMENVPPLVTEKKYRPLFDRFVAEANENGFDVVANVLDAANYGVPQFRRRAMIMGTRQGTIPPVFPMPVTWGFGSRADGERWRIGIDEETEDEHGDDDGVDAGEE